MRLSHRSIVVLRRILLAVASVSTLLAVFITEENWRGDRAWAAFEQEMRAKGEPIEFKAFPQRPVPDNQNFFKTPMLSRLIYDRPDDSERKKLMEETRLTRLQFWSVKSRKDLSAFSLDLKKSGLMPDALTGAAGLDVLRAMESVRPVLDEIREAALTRPLASLEPRSTPIGEGIAADAVWQLGQALAARAFAELEAGRREDAFADTIALQRLANALSNQPDNLLNLMIGVAMHGLAAAVISSGCEDHIWTGTELARFKEKFGQLNPLLNFRDAMRKERATVLYAVDLPPNKELRSLGVPFWLFHGWLQQNKLTYCRDLEASTLSAFTVEPPRVFSGKLSSTGVSTKSKGRSPFRVFSRLAIPNCDSVLGSLAASVDKLTLTSVACSIEQYRLAKDRYPSRLRELAPTFIQSMPSGIVDGQAARYSQLPQGSFKLWFVGPNGNDDDGKGDDISFPRIDG